MDFKHHIFISYRHIDDKPYPAGSIGWVSKFHHILETALAVRRGEEQRLWRDVTRMKGNENLSETLFDTLSESALLVSIVSPSYLKSQWCSRELRHFCQEAEKTGGLGVGEHGSRLFKVDKEHIPLDQCPPEFQTSLGYRFYEFDEAQYPKALDQPSEKVVGEKYMAVIERLAREICETLDTLETSSEESPQPSKKLIYLSETTDDLREIRESIRQSLEMDGHRVLPSQMLPPEADFSEKVLENMSQCEMSIHLVSPSAHRTQEFRQKLMAAKTQEQINISSQCVENKQSLTRIFWMPPTETADSSDPFIRSIQSEPNFLSMPVESLKTTIQDQLQQQRAIALAPVGNGSSKVYLDCDEDDFLYADDIEPIYDWLRKRFDEVVLPEHGMHNLSSSEARLKQCEAVLIYYGRARDFWFERRICALQKALRNDRPQPLRAKAIYVSRPNTPKKQNLNLNIPVINGIREFSAEILNVFSEQLEA